MGGGEPKSDVPTWASVRDIAGRKNALAFFATRLGFGGDRIAGQRVARLTTPLATHPVWCRVSGSDLEVYRRVFVERRYGLVDPIEGVSRIVDVGAHTGLSAAYLLGRFPKAELAALEPDPGNAAILARNLEPYGDRARSHREALWSRPARLVVERDDREGDALDVREARGDEAPQVDGIDLPGVLDRLGWDRIDLLKIDIGRSARTVFQPSCEAWLHRVRHIAITLHDDEGRRVFFGSVEPHWREIHEDGALTLCTMKRT